MKIKRKQDLLYDFEQEYSETNNQFYFESERRDLFYSALIKDIVINNRTSQTLKIFFFTIVCFVFVGVCGVGAYVLISIANKSDISLTDAGTALTGFGSIIGAIIVLPNIIAKHLFPGNSEEVRFNFLKSNHQFDQNQFGEDENEELPNIHYEDTAEDDAN